MIQLKTEKMPLHLLAQQHIRELIDNDTFPPGARLPSEAELSSQMGISRPTLREALKSLEEQSVIVRRHGVGTFVSRHAPLLETGLEVLESIQRKAKRSGLTLQTRDLDVRKGEASELEIRMLGLAPGTSLTVTQVTRTICIDAKPVARLTDMAPRDLLSEEDLGEPFNGSVLDLLLDREDLQPTTSRSTIDAVSAEKTLARQLGVSETAPLLKFTGQLFGFDQRILAYSLSYFVPGTFKFSFTRNVFGR